jgi:NAD(P) transhydrogenase subunit alpha
LWIGYRIDAEEHTVIYRKKHFAMVIAWLASTLVVSSCLAAGAATDVAAESPAEVRAITSADSNLPEEATSPSGMSRREALIASLTIFVLSIFVGFEVITKVPPTLHTPLMSGSNAISGITLVGAVLVAGGTTGPAAYLGMLAVALAAINVVGGFMVTDRMLAMFRGKKG